MVQGVIRKIVRLSTGTHVPAACLLPAHNAVGYGYIQAAAGDVYFDYSAVGNLHFDLLRQGMPVEFTLDDAPYLRTSKATVLLVEEPAAAPNP